MVHRAADGTFQSGTPDIDMEVFTGVIDYNIQAADLGSFVDIELIEGEEAEILDMSPFMRSDESFQVHRAELNVQITTGITATAEHGIESKYSLSTDSTLKPLQNERTGTSNTVAIRQDDEEDTETIFRGHVNGSGSFRDTTTGTGGGEDKPHVQHVIQYPELGLPGPVLDENDELYLPTRLRVDGSDDQEAGFRATVVVMGHTVDE